MKVRASVKKICRNCKVVRRKGVVEVLEWSRATARSHSPRFYALPENKISTEKRKLVLKISEDRCDFCESGNFTFRTRKTGFENANGNPLKQ